MKILGVDCGIHGGLAIIEIANGTTSLIDAIDIPVCGIKARERVDVLAIRSWIQQHQPNQAVIERAGSMPKQGVASTFKYARAAGSIEAVITLCEVPVVFIEASAWKRKFNLRGKDKESARQLALQRFPNRHELFALKKHHQRAEACLLALAGANHGPT